MDWIVPLLFFYKYAFRINRPTNVDIPLKKQRPTNVDIPLKKQRPTNVDIPLKKQRPTNVDIPLKKQRPTNVDIPLKKQRPTNVDIPLKIKQRPTNVDIPLKIKQRQSLFWGFLIVKPHTHAHIYTNTNVAAPWCNGYQCRKWTQWPKFMSRMRLFTFHIAIILLGKVSIQGCFF